MNKKTLLRTSREDASIVLSLSLCLWLCSPAMAKPNDTDKDLSSRSAWNQVNADASATAEKRVPKKKRKLNGFVTADSDLSANEGVVKQGLTGSTSKNRDSVTFRKLRPKNQNDKDANVNEEQLQSDRPRSQNVNEPDGNNNQNGVNENGGKNEPDGNNNQSNGNN